MKKTVLLLLQAFLLNQGLTNKINAQSNSLFRTVNYVFSEDSLRGFDLYTVSVAALNSACVGEEYKVFMYNKKRKFVNEKYNLRPSPPPPYSPPGPPVFAAGNISRTAVLPSSGACSNEDFEDAQANPGPQIGGAVNGWTLYGGFGASFCNPSAMSATNLYTVYNAPCVDPYMISPNNIVSSYFDAVSNTQPAGSCFIRLNNANAGAKVVRASKSYTVSPSNAVFQFAYRAVISNPGHPCCDQPGFRINVTITNTVTQTSSLLACPQVTVAAGNACGPAAPGFSNGNLLNGSPSAYNASWVPAAIDLSAYLGYAVTLDVYAIDCNYSGHAGYVYFDALCSPMTIIGNGQGFPAGTSSITLPTCGAAGATITAPPGLGPYSWNSGQISIPANLTVPNYTNTTLVTNQSGTLQLTMNPPGSCQPINKIITVTITPAPVALATATQPGCTNTLSAASLTCAGSASVNPIITWSPAPGSLSGNSLTATGLPVGITTITVQDPQGCQVIATVNILAAPPPVTFTINNLTGSYSITCFNPTINLQAVTNYTYGSLSFSWTSISFTANTSTVSINNPNTLTVTVADPATGCQDQATVSIGINTLAPTSSVNPNSQVVTCNTGSPVTFTSTITNPTVNIQHDWFSPLNPPPAGVPIATSNNSISILSGNVPPGTYTVITTNLVNGCTTAKTITVTSLSAFPTFSINSSTNFSLGCSPLNQTTISIVNPVSTQTPPATCSFTFLPPTFTGAVTPSVILGNNSSTTTTIPGTWTVIVQDNSNFCRSEISLPIIQNTLAPNVAATLPTYTLLCKTPTIFATGTSSTPNTDITWLLPINPPNLSQPTLVVGTTTTGPNTSTTSLSYANYTVVATNTINACQSTSVVQIYQNFKPPISTPTISIGTATAIYCTAADNPVVLTTGNSTTTSGGGPSAFAVPYLWEGPSPQSTVTGASSYSCYVPGIYSLTIMDNYNGCTKTSTINVLDRTQPPVIAEPMATATLDCGNNQAQLNAVLNGTTAGGVRYLYIEYPTGAAFNPTSAPVTNLNPLLSGTNSQSVSVSLTGNYYYVVSNTLTGCQAAGTFVVLPGDITAEFTPDQVFGYAPLTVQFNNTSHTSLGTSSINSVWSFGNGAVSTGSNNLPVFTTYTSPGTYTVLLTAQKGGCIDTSYRVIKVDLPSVMEVPNVFTPNGDGVNDNFFLKATNLTEIYAIIFDRWGNKVYEVNSSSGNINWDGKSLKGSSCPAGTYFYVIKATGKDSQTYQQKGNVSLFR